MSNKFEHFLTEEDSLKQTVKKEKREMVSHPFASGKLTSIKLQQETVNQLLALKTILKEKSYSSVLNIIISDYLDNMSDDMLDKFNLLS